MLLRFRVENHRCFQDAVEVSLVAKGIMGAVPADRDWLRATTRVAGIFGANASGKSTLLHAIDFMRQAVRYSATRWGDREFLPHHPFILDELGPGKPSSYEMDFVLDNLRYNYGFVSDATGVHEEWLYAYRTNRRTMLFEREGAREPQCSFGRTLAGENATISRLVRPMSLYLSTAANNNHPVLSRVYNYLARHIDLARRCDQSSVNSWLHWRPNTLESEKLRRSAESLIRFADLGIVRLDAESGGTVAWLNLGVPAVQAILHGKVFMVDEIGSSLHPRLTAALIQLFKDRSVNKRGGQLIFTSHDATILGSLAGEALAPDEVWFTEKRQDGASDLYALNEFQVSDSDNVEQRYLRGRYGAVPIVEFEDLRRSLLALMEE